MQLNLAIQPLLGPDEERNNLVAADILQSIYAKIQCSGPNIYIYEIDSKNTIKSTFFLKNKAGLWLIFFLHPGFEYLVLITHKPCLGRASNLRSVLAEEIKLFNNFFFCLFLFFQGPEGPPGLKVQFK